MQALPLPFCMLWSQQDVECVCYASTATVLRNISILVISERRAGGEVPVVTEIVHLPVGKNSPKESPTGAFRNWGRFGRRLSWLFYFVLYEAPSTKSPPTTFALSPVSPQALRRHLLPHDKSCLVCRQALRRTRITQLWSTSCPTRVYAYAPIIRTSVDSP